MIRYSLLVIAMLIIAGMSFKNWYRGLCFMLPLLAVLERPDMPRTMLGIGGLNPFNILLGIILLCWLVQRRHDGSHWNANRTMTRLFVLYMVVIVVSTIRMAMDLESLQYAYLLAGREVTGLGDLLKNEVFNTFKWLLVGLLISVGARSEQHVRLALTGVLITGALLGMQVISKMLPGLTGADDLAERALRVLDRDLGYHRVDLAAIMASVSWAFLASQPILKTEFRKLISIGGFGLCTIAMVATGGRAGMVSWAAGAFVMGFLRWRKILFLVPVFAILALALIPGLQDRLTQGFSGNENVEQAQRRAEMGAIDDSGRDNYAITSGRIVVWPLVIDKAMEKPLIGHGREAMQRTGIVAALEENYGITSFGHPHNAFLQLFIDTGFIGLVIVGLFYWKLFRIAAKEFAEPSTNTRYVVASMAVAFLVVNMTASLGSQSFYPTQGATLYWIVIGLSLALLTPKEPAPAAPRSRARRESVSDGTKSGSGSSNLTYPVR